LLRALAVRKTARQADLVRDLEASSGGTNEAIHRLQKLGLVTSNKAVFSLTPAGQDWLAKDAAALALSGPAPTDATPAAPTTATTEDPLEISGKLVEGLKRQLREQAAQYADEVAAQRRLVEEERAYLKLAKEELAELKAKAAQDLETVNGALTDACKQLRGQEKALAAADALRQALKGLAGLDPDRTWDDGLLVERAQARAKKGAQLAEEIRRMLGGATAGDWPLHELRAYEAAMGAQIADKDAQIRELREKAEAYRALRVDLLAPAGLDDTATDDVLVEAIARLIHESNCDSEDYAHLRGRLIAALTCPAGATDTELIQTVTHWATTWPESNPPREQPAPPAPAAQGRQIRRAAELLAEAAAADDRAQVLASLAPGGEGLASIFLTSAEVYHLVDLHGARADALADEARALL
jgi:DNA-binding PadR family transcriptional regulator